MSWKTFGQIVIACRAAHGRALAAYLIVWHGVLCPLTVIHWHWQAASRLIICQPVPDSGLEAVRLGFRFDPPAARGPAAPRPLH